jgi:tripartite-type tricarboxylate transporter receptor subunit TctC
MPGRRLTEIVAVIAAVLGSDIALAQTFPSAPIRIYTSAIGGGVDIVARIIAEDIAPRLGQPVVVENRGGSASIPAQIVAKAPPDGHTMLFYGSPIWLLPLLQKTPYDPIRDFAPITLAASSPNILVVHPVLPVRSIKDLIALAKAQPGKLNYSAGVAGSSAHLAAELFKSMARVDIVRITYKGSAPALTAVVSGEAQLNFAVASGVPGHVQAGRLKALAVTSARPSPLAPGLPTIAEQGLPGYEAILDLGVYAPAATPAVLIDHLNREMARTLASGTVKEKLFRIGFEPVGSPASGLLAGVKADTAKWGKLIKEAGIRAD